MIAKNISLKKAKDTVLNRCKDLRLNDLCVIVNNDIQFVVLSLGTGISYAAERRSCISRYWNVVEYKNN